MCSVFSAIIAWDQLWYKLIWSAILLEVWVKLELVRHRRVFNNISCHSANFSQANFKKILLFFNDWVNFDKIIDRATRSPSELVFIILVSISAMVEMEAIMVIEFSEEGRAIIEGLSWRNYVLIHVFIAFALPEVVSVRLDSLLTTATVVQRGGWVWR